MKPDIVAEFVALAREAAPDVPQATLQRLESEIRERHGGCRVYIGVPRTRPAPTIDDINARLHQSVPVSAIAKDLGVSRATIYRMLSSSSAKVARRPKPETKRRA